MNLFAYWLKLIAFSSFSSTFFFFLLIHSQTFAPLERDEDVMLASSTLVLNFHLVGEMTETKQLSLETVLF